MRHLPIKRNPKQNLIVEAVKDFYGVNSKSISKLSLWLMNRRKGLEPLTEKEKEDLLCIKQNIV